MELKIEINKQDFFNKLIQSKCKFKKIKNFYLASCKNGAVKYIAIPSNLNHKNVKVFQLTDEEAKFIKQIIKTFPLESLEINGFIK